MTTLSRLRTGIAVSVLVLLGAQLHAQTVINTVSDLQAMQSNLSGSYILGGNIDATSTSTANGGVGFTPIGTSSASFTGTFDGKGYAITGLSINSSLQNVGLFGYIASPAVIQNVSLASVSITGIGASGNVGTLVGYMGYKTSVTQCSAQGTLQASNGTNVGGLVGYSYGGSVTYCQASVNVTSTTAGGSIGGLIGFSASANSGQNIFTPYANVQYSQASGNVNGITTGSSQAWIGGLVGRNDIALLTHSRSTGNVTGTGGSFVGGLVGQNVGWLISCTEDTCNNGNVQPLAGITYSFATGAVATGAGGDAGGLIGDTQDGYIYQDFATGSVTNTDGGGREGGLLGVSEGSAVEDSYSTGSVTDNTALAMGGLIGLEEYFYYASKWQITPILSSLYSIGAVQGQYPKYAGGLAGEDTSGRGATCAYWATDSSLQSNSADGTGVLLAQLDNGSLPSCFDPTIWSPTSGTPPTLISNPTPQSGYVSPKYQIVGITYAPPGASGSTFVQYQNSNLVGNSQTVSHSFKDENKLTLKLSAQADGDLPIIGGAKAGSSYSVTTDYTQQTKNSNTITTSLQVQQGEKTAGTDNSYSPVNHDYDLIWVWLNPLTQFTIYPTGGAGASATSTIEWAGYAADSNDLPDLDIIGIPLGYLNGDFGSMPPQYSIPIAREWAAGQTWQAGHGPGLSATDLAQIAAADPFANPNYGNLQIGYAPPDPTTSDHRFTVSQCSGGSSFPYQQASPSAGAETYTCTLTYTNTDIHLTDSTYTYSVEFSADLKFGVSAFFFGLETELTETNTLTWTSEYQNQTTNTSVSTASLSVQSPPCNNAVLGFGPCVPVYDAAGNQPTQFIVYEDNLYGTFMFAPVGYYTGTPGTVATPQFGPLAGSYNAPQTVTITSVTPGAALYYTTDGTAPTITSTQYTGPIAVKASETVQAIAVASGYTPSAVGSAAYTITGLGPAATPTFGLAAGTYSQPQSVGLMDATPGATIYYTTNGSTPTTSSAVYSGPIGVSSTETIEAIATANSYTTSSVASAAYTITNPQTATPAFSLASGTYLSSQTVSLYDATPGAMIYYTTNGTTPTTNSPVYGGSIIVSATETIQAIAVAPGSTQSSLASALYTITPPTASPTFSTSSGTYTTGLTVSISDAVSGAVIYFTTNGTPPTTSSPVYTSPITVNATDTIQAMAVASGSSPSAIAVAVYTISTPTATPIFNPLPGTFTTTQTVTISDGTPGATIYFTTNGTTPTVGSSVYTGAITVSSSTTIQAIAIAAGDSTSALGTAAYTITSPPTTATPTMSVPQGAYSSTQMVTISDATPGAAIYYTTNGSQPTTTSTPYTTAITVGTTETIEAIAIAPGYSPSMTASAAYTINALGADFQIASSASTLNIAQGKSGTVTITITPQYGFGAQVSFGCGGLPSEATCNFSPVTVTPSGSPQSSTLTISTTASSAMLHDTNRGVRQIAFALLLPGLVVMWGVAPRRRSLSKALRPLVLLLLLIASLGITACGSGTSGSALFGNPGTPTGSAVVTVYGVSNGTTATTHMAFISVTVTP